MGVLSGIEGDSAQDQNIKADHEVTTVEPPKTDNGNDPRGFKTDVDGIFADGERNGVPVFDVEKDDFYRNMKIDRRRLRFNSGSSVQQYHSKTRYNRPFYIRNKDDGFMRYIGKPK